MQPGTHSTLETSSQSFPDGTPTITSVHRVGERQLPSPTRIANTGARRCRGPALLKSPARPGHSACIRQIFDCKQQRPLDLLQNQIVIYPSLANVSRQVSPIRNRSATSRNSTKQRGYQPRGPHHLLDTDATAGNLRVAFPYIDGVQTSSESWSDDSGYLNEELPHIWTSLAGSSKERIQDWLSTTCDHKSDSIADSIGEDLSVDCEGRVPGPRPVSPQIFDPFKELDLGGLRIRQSGRTTDHSESIFGSPPASGLRTAVVVRASVPTNCTAFRQELESSPLSPNVCTERGPSRYHTNRIPEVATSPSLSRCRPLNRVQQERLVENLALKDKVTNQDYKNVCRERQAGTLSEHLHTNTRH